MDVEPSVCLMVLLCSNLCFAKQHAVIVNKISRQQLTNPVVWALAKTHFLCVCNTTMW